MDYQQRVNYAAACITAGRRPSREFDYCFEMYDGAEVVAALVRRAEARPYDQLAVNLPRYINLEHENTVQAVRDLAHVPTGALCEHANETRARALADFRADMEERGVMTPAEATT